MIEFRQKEFTDNSIAKNNRGEILQAIIHILKLKKGYDKDINKNHHRSDISNGFLKNTRKDIRKDDKSKGPAAVMRNFKLLNEGNINHIIAVSQNKFRIKYNDPGCIVTEDEVNLALEVVEECLKLSQNIDNQEEINKTIYELLDNLDL